MGDVLPSLVQARLGGVEGECEHNEQGPLPKALSMWLSSSGPCLLHGAPRSDTRAAARSCFH